MNLSLRNRVLTSFVIANAIVLILGFTIFFFLDSLHKDIDVITQKSNRVTLLIDEIRISTVSILKQQRKIISKKSSEETVEKIVSLCDGLHSQLQTLDSFYNEAEVKKIIAKMTGYVDSLKLILGKAGHLGRGDASLQSVGDLADKILETFSEFQDIQYYQNEERDRHLKKIINETKRNMMITLIITFLGTILLGLIIPGKIALPFKKIDDAIRELQECNFDVSIYYNQDDEIGEMANEMNKMIHNMKKFEELRTDRISVELRKFDALANMLRKHVLVANANSEVIYMNNSLYSLLQLQSDDVISKVIHNTLIPDSMKEVCELAIKRRSKIENAQITFPLKQENEGEEGEELPELSFEGFANIIPIRGKESSLDYYLMVMSQEVNA